MDEVFLRTITLPTWLVEKHFKNEDYVSVEDLIAKVEDLDSDLESLQEEFEDYKEYVQENYKEKSFEEKTFSCN